MTMRSMTDQEKRTHRADADLLGDLGLLVDVDLVELDARDLLRELLEDRRDHAAGTAPGRPKVEYGDLARAELQAGGERGAVGAESGH